MPNFSKSSETKLFSCDFKLQLIFNAVIKHFDCTVLEGHRTLIRQAELFELKKTKIKKGKHNTYPSQAVDVAPYPIDWQDRDRLHLFAGFVKGVAVANNIKIRWGGDWDNDTLTNDNQFDDLVHFELID